MWGVRSWVLGLGSRAVVVQADPRDLTPLVLRFRLLRGGFLRRRNAAIFLISTVKRRQDAFPQYLGLGLNPVFKGTAFGLPALVVDMLRVQADLSFQQLGHECLLLLSAGIVVQNYSFSTQSVFQDKSIIPKKC